MVKIHLNEIAAKTLSKTLWELYPQRRHLPMPWDQILTHYKKRPKLTDKIHLDQAHIFHQYRLKISVDHNSG